MAIIAPPSVGTNKKPKIDKMFLKDALAASMREIITTEDGRQMTVAQAGAERLKNIWLYAKSNTDSIAAGKLIFERLYGRAAVEKVEDTKEMPKVIFALGETDLKRLNQVAKEQSPQTDDDDDAGILIEDEDGKEILV